MLQFRLPHAFRGNALIVVIIGARILLTALVVFGVYSSAGLAWREFTLGEACPHVGSVPACYVAFAAYLATFSGLVWALTTGASPAIKLLFAGAGLAFLLALLGSVLELVVGNICPRAGSVPMCFLSLGMALIIGVLAWWSIVACDV